MLKVNQWITIIIPNAHDKSLLEQYMCRIEKIEYDRMIIATPAMGFSMFLFKDKTIKGRFANEHSAYEFTCTYINKHIHKNTILWTISLPYDIKKIQTRKHFRLNISIPIKVRVIENGEKNGKENETKENESEILHIYDISAGGVKIIYRDSLQLFSAGKLVDLSFDIPNYGTITAIGKILRIEKAHTSEFAVAIAVEFVDILEKEKDAIAQFLFKKQLEKHQNKNHHRRRHLINKYLK